jgi:hypothetical protein
MALADYHSRSALAAAQILDGFDEEAFAERLARETVELRFGQEALRPEGRAALDMLVRLVARLYPTMSIRPGVGADGVAAELSALARAINPKIDLVQSEGTRVLAVGGDVTRPRRWTMYVGSAGPDALVSSISPQPVGVGDDPFGPGAAACFAAASLFRACFPRPRPRAGRRDGDLVFSTRDLEPRSSTLRRPGRRRLTVPDGTALVGVGAIGNAVIWGLSRVALEGSLHLVDAERVELSNLQRYVLTDRNDDGNEKPGIARRFLKIGEPHLQSWANFVAARDYHVPVAIVALDSAHDRRAVNASLPRRILNAWTQPGDLGVSSHDFLGGACLACLYLPAGRSLNQDEIVADALRVPERLREVREYLHLASPLNDDFLASVAIALGVEPAVLDPYRGRTIRELYVEGACGGQVISLSRVRGAPTDVHVPLAHQSALAGVLLAAQFVEFLRRGAGKGSRVTRLDVLRAVPTQPTQPAAKDPRGICVCQDELFRAAYRSKYAVD